MTELRFVVLLIIGILYNLHFLMKVKIYNKRPLTFKWLYIGFLVAVVVSLYLTHGYLKYALITAYLYILTGGFVTGISQKGFIVFHGLYLFAYAIKFEDIQEVWVEEHHNTIEIQASTMKIGFVQEFDKKEKDKILLLLRSKNISVKEMYL